MKKKILAISICVCICFVLLAIPVFATSAPETTSSPNVFNTLFDSDSPSYYFFAWTDSSQQVGRQLPTSACTVASPFSLCGVTFSVGDTIRASNGADSSFNLYKNEVSTSVSNVAASASGTDGLYLVQSSLEDRNGVRSGTLVQGSPAGLVPEFADEVFSVGGSLISFVMSHWIVLIPVVAFLVILCIGAIRKLIKGV